MKKHIFVEKIVCGSGIQQLFLNTKVHSNLHRICIFNIGLLFFLSNGYINYTEDSSSSVEILFS